MKINILSIITALSVALTFSLPSYAVENNPKASEGAVVTYGNARFTVLTPRMIRIEYSDSAVFEDRATFAIVNRNLDVPEYECSEDSEYLYITTDDLNLKYRKGSNPSTTPASPRNLSVTFKLNGNDVVWYPGKPDPLNLKGTYRTLDGNSGDEFRKFLEDGVISRSGWAVINDSWGNVRAEGSRSFAFEHNDKVGFDWMVPRTDQNAVDLYFMAYGHDYKDAIRDFTKIAGKIPLPPAYVFGYWYSKYESYTADDIRDIIKQMETNNIPCDVMIIDMDWHWNGDERDSNGRGGWTGWSWNTNLIPDPKGLLSDIHSKNLKVALNLHPAQGISKDESPEYFSKMNSMLGGKYVNDGNIAWALDDVDFKNAFFNTIIRDLESYGVDFWWLDWQQHMLSPYTWALGETFWCNHVFFNDMKLNRPDRRPVIFHRWGGLGSHRYQIGFSGDSFINFKTLAFEPYFTSTSSNVGYGFWGHDLGGHMVNDEALINDPDLVLRWIQYGVFSPIFRTHATKDPRIERQMWKFPNFPLMRQAVRLRYNLFPYIYTMARETYDTGISICRPMYYEHPEAEEAYAFEEQYMFGNDILVAPVTEPLRNGKSQRVVWFPEGKWWDVSHGKAIVGPCIKELEFAENEIPYFYRAGAIIPLNPDTVMKVTDKPSEIRLHIVAGDSGKGALYEDRGDNQNYDSSYAKTVFTHKSSRGKEYIVLEARSGDQQGLNAERSFSIHLFDSNLPKKIMVDGSEIDSPSWQYNASSRELKFKLPESSAEKKHKIEIKY